MLAINKMEPKGVVITYTTMFVGNLIGALSAFIILNEPFTIIQMVAGGVMLYGVYLLYKK